MRAGILHGFVGQLEYLVAGIRKELGDPSAPVIATGGWGKILLKHTQIFDHYDPFLTLEGIRQIALGGNGFSSVEVED
jgi:type III pantothenate kinase